jgi:hydrogenase-4 component B
MQYTAASFAALITDWFALILRPERHETRAEEYFPLAASRSQHTPETVLERLVEPVGRVILRISLMARRLQHGRVQSYVLYILIGLGMLAAWVFLRGLPSFAT